MHRLRMCWAGAFDVYLENRLYNFVDNLVEVFLLDATEATQDVTLDITGDNLALHEAGLLLRCLSGGTS